MLGFCAKIVQTKAMRTCSQMAECSLSYAKIMEKEDNSKQADVFLLVRGDFGELSSSRQVGL